MAKLEDITPNRLVTLPTETSAVTVIAIDWQGSAAIEVTFKRTDGSVDQTIVLRADENDIHLQNARPWSFDADSDKVRLVSEAYRISLAHLLDPYLAVRTSAIDPLPHQISAVYKEMLPRLPLRYVLADDPGAGKTVMAGLLIKEMMARGDLERCLVVCPGSLAEQWQDELHHKFGLRFTILTNDCLEAAVSGNAFLEYDLCIARMDKLARDEAIQEKLKQSTWDLIICDEAHKMSATVFGNEVKYTKRYHLGEMLGNLTENLLLMTATPHNGKSQDFQLFMALVDKDRFEGAAHTKPRKIQNLPSSSDENTVYQVVSMSPEPFCDFEVSDVMRRLVKEELLKFDGTPLFPERIAYTVNYALSPAEADLYEAVTDYVRDEFNRADRLDGKRRNSVGFALTSLQRRLASSPEAIYQSLHRRRERLEARLAETKLGKSAMEWTPKNTNFDDFDEDDYTEEELENIEGEVIDTATAAATVAELEAEIGTLQLLERKANDVRTSGKDRKWDELSGLLQNDRRMFDNGSQREKLIIFTEHRDTLRYLTRKIRSLLGNEAVITIQGGMSRDDRRQAEELFKQDKQVRILIATDAAGEGINLQRAHLMINYDLPWNPNRLEQRFGRIHRIGQTEVCHLWNLVSNETREGEVFARLFKKLDEEKKALGGRVFDVLGRLTFNNRPLRELLVEAVRYGNRPEVKDRLYKQVDNALNTEELTMLLNRYALTNETMAESDVVSIREDMERTEARKLEPHFIEQFFLEAMHSIGGKVIQRESGRYEIPDVPLELRSFGKQLGYGDLLVRNYERVCFAKNKCNIIGYPPPADLICPGHPLLDALTSLLLAKNKALLKQGCIFIDKENRTDQPRLLFYIETALADSVTLSNGRKRVISKSIRFIEIGKDGTAQSAGYAPYLDYESPSTEDTEVLLAYIKSSEWLNLDVEPIAKNYAIQHIIPSQLQIERQRRNVTADKTEHAVRERLTAEIRYWDAKTNEIREKERQGKNIPKVTSLMAARKAEDLANRMKTRLERIEQERRVTALPPRIVGGAIVVPRAFLNSLLGNSVCSSDTEAKKRIEKIGMRTVMAIERELGNEPRDVSKQNIGYDIESRIGEDMRHGGDCFRFIEVKGRTANANTVTVSRNEVLSAMNNPNRFILAIVEVDGGHTRTTYVKNPFNCALSNAEISGNFSIDQLKAAGEIILEKEQQWQ